MGSVKEIAIFAAALSGIKKRPLRMIIVANRLTSQIRRLAEWLPVLHDENDTSKLAATRIPAVR